MTFLVNYTFSKTLTDVDSTVGVANGAGAFGAQAERQEGERMSTRWEHCVENGFTGLALNHHSRGQLTTPFFSSPADSRTRLLE